MFFEDYISQTYEDAKEILRENIEYYIDSDFDEVFYELENDDSVTGNMSGSYTFSTYEAKRNVADIIWDEDFLYELNNFGWSLNDVVEKGPETVDVIARCVAIGYNYSKLEDYFNELKEEAGAKE